MEMECPHLTYHRKAPVKGIIGPGKGGLPCGIDDLRVLARCWSAFADFMSVGNCASGLKMGHNPGNEDAPGKSMRCHDTLAAESTRLWLRLFSPKSKTMSTFSSDEKKTLQCLT